MRINFFEEFPISLNLSKAKLIQFPSTIFLAATSLEHFNTAKKKLKKINPKLEAAYWPILPKADWMAPIPYPSDNP